MLFHTHSHSLKGLKPITSTGLPNPPSSSSALALAPAPSLQIGLPAPGYQVAATGRSVGDDPVHDGYLNIKADLTDPAVVPDVFAKVKAHFSTPPNIIVCTMVHAPTFPRGLLKLFLPSDPEFCLEIIFSYLSKTNQLTPLLISQQIPVRSATARTHSRYTSSTFSVTSRSTSPASMPRA